MLYFILSFQRGRKKSFLSSSLFGVFFSFFFFFLLLSLVGKIFYCSLCIEQDLQPNYDSLSLLRSSGFELIWLQYEALPSISNSKKEFNNALILMLDFISFIVDLRFALCCAPFFWLCCVHLPSFIGCGEENYNQGCWPTYVIWILIVKLLLPLVNGEILWNFKLIIRQKFIDKNSTQRNRF